MLQNMNGTTTLCRTTNEGTHEFPRSLTSASPIFGATHLDSVLVVTVPLLALRKKLPFFVFFFKSAKHKKQLKRIRKHMF